MTDYAREMTVKKFCKYGYYISFDHLPFLYCSAQKEYEGSGNKRKAVAATATAMTADNVGTEKLWGERKFIHNIDLEKPCGI